MKGYVCIDIGGTAIKYGLSDHSGVLFDRAEMATEAFQTGGPGILEKIKRIVGKYLAAHEVQGVAISTAGMVDSAAGVVVYAAPHIIPEYTGMALKAEIEKAFSLPCEIENDVNCAGLGELWHGAARGAKSVFCLAVGTGIGGCVILDGRLVRGAGNSAGEIGYMRVAGGVLQDLASTSALVKAAAEEIGISVEKLDGRKIFALAQKGDEAMLRVIDRTLASLADGIANVCYVLNPEVFILGGGIMAQASFLAPRIDQALKGKMIPNVYKHTRITFAVLQNDAGMLGALYHFFQRQDGR